MTATHAPATSRGPADPAAALTLASEVALAAVTLSAVLGLGRLFEDGAFLLPLTLVAGAGHLTAALARRRHLSLPASAAAGLVGGFLVVTWVRYLHTTALGIPTPRTLHALSVDLSDAWHQFSQVVAPAPVTPGFVLASAVAVWGVAWFSDWAAFRLGAAIEATLPAAAIFLFAAMLGAPKQRVAASAAFVAATLAFVLLHTTGRRARSGAWVGHGGPEGVRALAGVGAALVVTALVGGLVVGPHLPGARSEPLVDWRGDRNRPATRITVSPLVEIRKRLVDQSDVEAFTVRSNRRAYWRLTSLDTFDGTAWTSGGSFDRASGDLPGIGTTGPTNEVRQEFQITGLSAIWLPAAFSPTHISSFGTKVRWDDSSSTLVVDDGSDSSNDISYEVASLQPNLTRARLDQPTGAAPEAIRTRYLAMPTSFPVQVRAQAEQITLGGRNDYERSRLLQDYFRDNFTYDLNDTPAGHSDSAIETFLDSRRGYCEQFAGTFAAMARAIGIPARVAVGFTPGDVDPARPDVFVVKGKHAHAWPEVWIAGSGWVAFEPTPGRGIPGAQAYTGVPEQQAGNNPTPGTTPTTAVVTPTTAGQAGPATTRPTGQVRTATPGSQRRSGSGGGLSLPLKVLVAIVVLLVGAIAWVVGLAATRASRRRRRRQAATTAVARVQVAWAEGAESVAHLGARLSPAETEHEFAARSRTLVGAGAPSLDGLADLASVAHWSAATTAEADAEQATAFSAQLEDHVRATLGRSQKLRRAVDPRPPRRGPQPR